MLLWAAELRIERARHTFCTLMRDFTGLDSWFDAALHTEARLAEHTRRLRHALIALKPAIRKRLIFAVRAQPSLIPRLSTKLLRSGVYRLRWQANQLCAKPLFPRYFARQRSLLVDKWLHQALWLHRAIYVLECRLSERHATAAVNAAAAAAAAATAAATATAATTVAAASTKADALKPNGRRVHRARRAAQNNIGTGGGGGVQPRRGAWCWSLCARPWRWVLSGHRRRGRILQALYVITARTGELIRRSGAALRRRLPAWVTGATSWLLSEASKLLRAADRPQGSASTLYVGPGRHRSGHGGCAGALVPTG